MEKVFISEMDQYYFGEGIHYEIYKKLGAHLSTQDGKDGVYFAVWAPHAQYVSVVGDFNEWQTDAHPMERLEPLGIWQIFVPEVKKGALYKYFVIGRILTETRQSFVPARRPRLRISPDINGVIKNGCRTG